MIEIKSVSYSYKDGASENRALTDINLTIYDGETVAIIGHTGSGKSTLVQTMNGLLRPTSGRIIIDGEDISEKKVKDICQSVGVVFQYPENQLFEETIRADIAFGPKNQGLDEAEINKRVASAAAMVGLDGDCLDKSPFELSGGQTRRAAIAGVIAMKPQILILDEPMAGLDAKGKDSVIEMIKKLRGDNEKMIVIFVSHSMEDAAKIAERAVVMNKGAIEEDGAIGEVFSHSVRLREIGLDVPQITSVMEKLRALGYGVSDRAFTVSDAAEEIKRLLAGVGNV